MEVPEQLLIRDCLHCCQGTGGGRYVAYQDDEYKVKEEYARASVPGDCSVSVPRQQLVRKITELGWLVRKMKGMMDEVVGKRLLGEGMDDAENAADGGFTSGGRGNSRVSSKSIVHEALVAACQRELSSCYRIIALLQSQCHSQGGDEAPLSLRRVLVWLHEPRQRLEIMASCLDHATRVRGGEALNVLHAMSKHGDPFVRDAVKPLLDAASAPYFGQIEQWVRQGIVPQNSTAYGNVLGNRASFSGAKGIHGQHLGEFLVLKLRTPRDHPHEDWTEGFTMDHTAQPKFIDNSLAKDVFIVGKTVHFLRKYCDESDWNDAWNDISSLGLSTKVDAPISHRLAMLRQLVRESKDTMNAKVVYIIKEKENFFRRLDAIKRYVLLAQGDFVRTFIDLADEQLRSSVKVYSEYSLQGHVGRALETCGSAYGNEDIMDCIRIRSVKEHQFAGENDIGWQLFGLTYALDSENSPSAVILDPSSMQMYGEISQMLWALKRAEHTAGLSWYHLESVSRNLATLRSMKQEHGIDLDNIIGKVPLLLRYLHALRADVSQFINSMQAHFVYQVIEPTWKQLLTEIGSAKDLDALIDSHKKALLSLSKGTFSEKKRSSMETTNSPSEVKSLFQAALNAAIEVYVPVERLSRVVYESMMKQRELLNLAQESERMGTWNEMASKMPGAISEETLEDIMNSAVRLHGIFDRHREVFFCSLPSNTRENLRR